MAETVKKRIAIRELSNPYFCVWLQEMAEQGMFLKRLGIWSADFNKGEPEKRRYRVLQKNLDSLSGDEKTIIAERGWKLVKAGSSTIVYTTDMQAPEPVDDPISHYYSGWIWSVIWILIICYWIYKIITSGWGLTDRSYIEMFGRIHAAEANGVLSTGFSTLAAVAAVVIGAQKVWQELLNLKHCRNKELPDYDIPYDDRRYLREKRSTAATRALIIAFFAGLLAMLPGYFVSGRSIHEGPAALSYEYDHPVQLEEIDPDMWERAVPLIEGSLNANTIYSVDYMTGKDDPGFYIKENYIQQISLDRFTDENEDEIVTEGRYYAEYLTLRNEESAEEYLGEQIAYDLFGKVEDGAVSKALEQIRIDVTGLDYAGHYTGADPTSVDGYEIQYLYLRQGKKVYIVSYTGSVDLRGKTDIYIKDMAE